MAEPAITETEEGVILSAKIVPGSSKTEFAGLIGQMLKVKVTAPAEKGKANKCLIEFLAKRIGVKKNDIEILSGHTGRTKKIRIAHISTEMILQRLDLPA